MTRDGGVAPIEFEVENVFTLTGRGAFVCARWLGPGQFETLHDATLGGCPIKPWTDIPRSKDANGEQRLDLYCFELNDPNDKERFAVGQLVELVAVSRG